MHIEYSNLFKKFQNSRSSPLFQLSKKMSGIVSTPPPFLTPPSPSPHSHPSAGSTDLHCWLLRVLALLFCNGFVDGLSLFVSHTHFYLSPPLSHFFPPQRKQKNNRNKKEREKNRRSQPLQPRRSRRRRSRRRRNRYQSRKKQKNLQIFFLVIRRSVRFNLVKTRRIMLLS